MILKSLKGLVDIPEYYLDKGSILGSIRPEDISVKKDILLAKLIAQDNLINYFAIFKTVYICLTPTSMMKNMYLIK